MNTSSNDTGSAAFSLKWETPSNNPTFVLPLNKGRSEAGLSYAPIDCTAIGVSTVTANVYDSGGTYITSGGPWNCADHSGTITGISAGINRMITISGKDSSNRIIYNGQITGVTIDKDQTTNAGQITMTYVANDTTAPTDGTLSASAGNSQVSLSWSGWTDSGSGIGSYKLVYSTTSTPSSCSAGTQIFSGTGTSYTHTGLTNTTTYYYRLCATDNAGNTSSGATASGTPQSTGTTTTTGGTTTGSAPSAPTGVSASAGNGQVTISWSSVSGATSYNIYWSTSSGVTKTSGTKITGATSPYTHTGLTNGTTYYYVVTAVNSYGESSESSQMSVADCTGGTITYSGGKTIHTFTSNGTLSCSGTGTVRYLVVAGGGGGGRKYGGGGGAGGFVSSTATVSAQSYTITVGSGGSGATSNGTNGGNGNNSSFGVLATSTGGGGGGGELSDGLSGGSGGGGGSGEWGNLSYGGSGTAGQGSNGGIGIGGAGGVAGAGGGGADANGSDGDSNGHGGAGGSGKSSDISGSSVTYAGGGGGKGGGIGGSGAGGSGGGGANGNPGTANTGGGGGGSDDITNGGNGGSGIVIISYTSGSLS